MAGDCSQDDCPVPAGFFSYQPSRQGNAVMLAAFALLVPVTLGFGCRFRTPLFALTLTTGLLLEVLGFTGRVMLYQNVADRAYFTLFLCGTILGPTFIAASVFIILPHAISVYGSRASSLAPRHVGAVFLALVVAVTIVEILGSVFAANAVPGIGMANGGHILAAGLGVQAATLLLFVGIHFWITIGLSGERVRLDPKHAVVYRSSRFKRFLFVMQMIAVLLLGHTVYRVVEMATGFDGPLFQNQVAFMIANGAMPLIACILLVAFTPGAAFGKAWGPTSPRFRSKPFKHNLRPSPLPSPTTPYDRRRSPRHVEFDQNSSRQSNSPKGPVPLRESTMATTVKTNPVTKTTAQPSPIATTQKYSPTFWLEHQKQAASQPKRSLSSRTAQSPTPKTSPTFQVGYQQPHQAQQQHQVVSELEQPQQPDRAADPQEAIQQPGTSGSGRLVDRETLW